MFVFGKLQGCKEEKGKTPPPVDEKAPKDEKVPKDEKPADTVDKEKPKAVLIIAHQNFRDEEYNEPKNILEQKGAEVKVASSSLEEAKGMKGATVKPDMLVKDINVEEMQAVVFIGGTGAKEYFQNQDALNVAKEAAKNDKVKVLAAICIAPVILANAGVLNGKNATVFPSEKEAIEEKGAKYLDQDVVVDGKIVTARGPEASKKFGQKIAELMGL
jgi:protease I